MSSFDVIVVGVGAMGASACYHLARRGVRVLGLERFDVPNARGSSHGYSRMTRMAYYEHPDYVPLLKRSWTLWRELEDECQQEILTAIGGLYMGGPGGELVMRSLQSARDHQLPHEQLDAAEVRRRYPQFHIPDDFVALHETSAGFLRPERAISALADRAMRRGAEIHAHEPVVEWNTEASGITVRTPRQTYRADRLVFCGGAWSAKLVRDLGVSLIVTRQPLGWVQPKRPELFDLGRLPVWAIDHGDGSLHYGFPIIPDVPGFKLAHHAPMTPTDPDAVDRDPRPEDEQTFRPVLARYLPDADGPLLAIRICLYTNSPDGHFILDRHPLHERVFVACGFSGHGFKFASVVGQELALATETGSFSPELQFLGLGRFRERGA
jgi:sarcosine oxidase